MTAHNNLSPHSEVKGIGTGGLVIMVIVALILFSVAATRGGGVSAQSRIKVLPDGLPSPGDRVRMWANTLMQGRPESPHDSWSVPVQTHVHEGGVLRQALTVSSSVTGTVPIAGLGTDQTYDVSVKGMHTLRVRRDNLTMTRFENHFDFGELPEGDANNDNTINALDASILASAFWTREGEPGFIDGADFNEDGVINALDASLMGTNYWRTGDPLPTP